MPQQENEKNRKQELYMELKELDSEVKKLNAHIEKIDEQMSELNSSRNTIAKFMELSSGDELKVPLTTGVYITAKIKDTGKLMINVGANVAVEKTPSEVSEVLDSQVAELTAYREKLIESMKVFIARIEAIQKEFE